MIPRYKTGDIIEVFGCTWDEDWEFGAPSVLYAPFKAYKEDQQSAESLLEDLWIDAMLDDKPMPTTWRPCTLKDFKWRGWDPKGFRRRKNARHTKITIRVLDDEEGGYEITDASEQKGPF